MMTASQQLQDIARNIEDYAANADTILYTLAAAVRDNAMSADQICARIAAAREEIRKITK